MKNPRIESNSWVMTCCLVDSDGEELWNLRPKEGSWIAVIHLQASGKLFLRVMKERTLSNGRVDQAIIADGLKTLSQKVYEERGTKAKLGIKAISQNAALFSTAKKAGFKRTDAYKEKKKVVLVYEYCPKR